MWKEMIVDFQNTIQDSTLRNSVKMWKTLRFLELKFLEESSTWKFQKFLIAIKKTDKKNTANVLGGKQIMSQSKVFESHNRLKDSCKLLLIWIISKYMSMYHYVTLPSNLFDEDCQKLTRFSCFVHFRRSMEEFIRERNYYCSLKSFSPSHGFRFIVHSNISNLSLVFQLN